MPSIDDAPVNASQTVEDALWGYKDIHGNWTAGLSQRVSAMEFKQNLSIGLLILSLGKLTWPDILSILAKTATAAAAATGHMP